VKEKGLGVIPDPKRPGYYWIPKIEKRFRKLKKSNQIDTILEEDAAIAKKLTAAMEEV